MGLQERSIVIILTVERFYSEIEYYTGSLTTTRYARLDKVANMRIKQHYCPILFKSFLFVCLFLLLFFFLRIIASFMSKPTTSNDIACMLQSIKCNIKMCGQFLTQ